MDLSFVAAAPLVAPPPTPVLQRLFPSSYWARKHWPDPHWPSGRDFTLYAEGSDFVVGKSVILLGSKELPGSCTSPRLIQAWVIPPDDPVTLQVRVRTGMAVSNPIAFRFFEVLPCRMR